MNGARDLSEPQIGKLRFATDVGIGIVEPGDDPLSHNETQVIAGIFDQDPGVRRSSKFSNCQNVGRLPMTLAASSDAVDRIH